jgi:hypothetical protein
MRRNRPLCIFVIAVIVGTATAATQDRPDFSGTWILVSTSDANQNAARTLVVVQSFSPVSFTGPPVDPPAAYLTVDRYMNDVVRSDRYAVGLVGGWVSGTNATQQTQRYSTTENQPQVRPALEERC